MRKKRLIYFSFIILIGIYFQYVTSAYGASGCGQAGWGFPLDTIILNSPFNSTSHFGVDYKAADGDNVSAVADGVVLKNGFNLKKLNKPDSRSGLMVKGWGRYVVLRHNDGSTTLYAHLIDDSTAHLKEGELVTKGTIIGKADSTGGSTGPHLHFEYTADGKWWHKLSKKDPHPCILGCNPEDTLTIIGSDETTTNSTKQYTTTGCPGTVTWGISGKGAITSTGLLTTGATACGTIIITANCSQCGTSSTKDVRVTDAGGWYDFIESSYCGVVDYSCYPCPGYYHNCGIATNIEIIGVEQWTMEWFIVPEESPCSCIAIDYGGQPPCAPILPFTPEPNPDGSGYGSGYGSGWKTCEIIYQQYKVRWACSN